MEDNKAFFDGGIPYIFPERSAEDNRILYINISNFLVIKYIKKLMDTELSI